MKIYDAVHGFIHFNHLESSLIDTEAFQRLHYIHQLGISYMVYPGGTHTRFEHSLGTMHLATRIFDHIAQKQDKDYWRQVIRLAALCHDLGHLPFSHVAENRLLGLEGHEAWTLKIIQSLAPLFGEYSSKHIAQMAIGEEKLKTLLPEVEFTPWQRIYSQIITGDFFGADRIDYLLRDAQATGLTYGLFDYTQLIEMLTVIPNGEELTLGIEENGIESCEALLLARHFMHRRVYQYSTAKAYSFHMARFMEIFYKDPKYYASVENYISMSEYEVLHEMQKARKDPNHPGHLDAACLFDRKKRFQAIFLPSELNPSHLEKFKTNLNIADEHIHWDFAIKNSLKYGLSLSVLTKKQEIVSANQLSQILIPPAKKNWLYLAPKYSFRASL